MPLHLRHLAPAGSWEVPYELFALYRRELARDLLDIDMDSMVGFGGETPWPDPGREPVVHLLDHPDNSGELNEDECEALRPVLKAWRPPAGTPEMVASAHTAVLVAVEACAAHGGTLRFR